MTDSSRKDVSMTQTEIDEAFDAIVAPHIHKPVDKQLGKLLDLSAEVGGGYPEDREPKLMKKVWK